MLVAERYDSSFFLQMKAGKVECFNYFSTTLVNEKEKLNLKE